MPTGSTWIMNCVLAGLETSKLIQEGKPKEAKELLRNLTSELTPDEIDYLFDHLGGNKAT